MKGTVMNSSTETNIMDDALLVGGQLEVTLYPSGERGATFTPSVDTNGNISWTNDQHKINPTTRNITGPKGDAATITLGTVTTSGDTASITNSGDEHNAVFDFIIPSKGTSLTVNEKDKGSKASIYAPEAAGTEGQVVRYDATSKAAKWTDVDYYTKTESDTNFTYTAGTGIKITNNKIEVDGNVTVYDDLDSTATDIALSAKQGKILNDKISGLKFKTLTQAQYDVETIDNDCIYFIIEDGEVSV